MRRANRIAWALVVLVLCFGSVPAAADPITLNYRVYVFQKLDLTRSFTDWQPITPVSFNLSVRFDGGVSTERISTQPDGRYAFTYFGTPDVSSVPLTGAGFTGGTHTAQTYVVNATVNGGLHQEALTLDQLSGHSDTTGGSRSVQLLKMGLDPPLPPGVLGDLSAFLTAMRDPGLAFYFSDLAYTRNVNMGGTVTLLPGSTTYYGAVTALNSDQVPEPATMTLVGLGLAAAVRARRRSS